MNMPFSVMDVLALAFLVLTTIKAVRRGLSGEFAHVFSFVPAFLAGLFGFPYCARWLVEHLKMEPEFAQAFAFIMAFVVALIVLLSVRLALRNLLKLSLPESLDRIGGLIAGLLRGGVIVLTVFILLNLLPHAPTNERFGEQSAIGRAVVARLPQMRAEVERRADARRRAREQNQKTGKPIWKILREERRARTELD